LEKHYFLDGLGAWLEAGAVKSHEEFVVLFQVICFV